MPKLLYLVHRIPYPPNKGDKIRSFHFLQALMQEYDVFLGCFIDDFDDKQYQQALAAICQEVFCVDLHPKIQKLKSLQGLLTGEALSLPYYRDQAMQDWVNKTIREQGIERVLVFSSPMAQYVANRPELHWVADFVDVDSDKWRQYALSKSWPASWIYNREAKMLLAYEQRITALAKATLFVSEQEAKLFKTLAPEQADKIGFVNNGVDTANFDPDLSYLSPYLTDNQVIVFTGAMDYWANVDAVKWFAEQVLPVIKQQQPEVKFYIVGSKPSKEVLQLAENDASVIVTGRVEDIRPYVAFADLVVAPLRIARGIQNKVLEALAMAKPVIASSAAMEGIPVGSDLKIAIADEAEDFAGKALVFLAESAERFTINRHFVQNEFSWQHNGQKLCQVLAGDTGLSDE